MVRLSKTDFSDSAVFEKEILKESCEDIGDFELINELLRRNTKTKLIMTSAYGLQNDLENHLDHSGRNGLRMLINRIVLNNFRVYHGEKDVNFLQMLPENITVIAGNNGFGEPHFLP